MEGYFIRIQQLESYDVKLKSLVICNDYEKILCVKHQGDKSDNPHYHLTIKTTVKPKAFRARMVGIFDQGKGNGHMSIKPWDGKQEANSYMFHEEDDSKPGYMFHDEDDSNREPERKEFINKGYEQSEVAALRALNKTIKEKVEANKQKASWKLEEVVLAQLQLKPINNVTQRDVAIEILKTCFESDKYQPNDFQLKLMSDRICYKLSKTETDKWHVIQSIVTRIKWD